MKTNRFFNFRRFYHLLCADFRLNGRRYLFTLAGGIIIVYLFILFEMKSYNKFTVSDYVPLFYVCAFGLSLIAGSAFPIFSNRIKAGNYLLLPASTLEKIASQFLIYVVFAVLAFLLIFWADTHLARWSMLQMADLDTGVVVEKFCYSTLCQSTDNLFIYIAISVGMFLFAARLFFKRYALIKSVVVLAIAAVLFICGLVLFSHIFYPEGTEGFEIALPQYKLASGLYNMEIFCYVLIYSVWLLSLPVTYYKLKEKQV